MTDDLVSDIESRVQTGPLRFFWFGLGGICVALGGIGIVVPGLPTLGFFVFAAACFSRCSPRLERWILDLPTIGLMVRDYRAGLGMRKAIKIRATVMMWLSIGLSVGLAIEPLLIKAIVIMCGVIGTWVIWIRTPLRTD